MKLSARNQLKGEIVAVTKGQTTSHVRIDIGGGVIVTSSIPNEAVDDLALKVGDDAFAVIRRRTLWSPSEATRSFWVKRRRGRRARVRATVCAQLKALIAPYFPLK